MKLPEREYYTLPELAERWNTTERHLLELMLSRKVDSVALYSGDAVISWADENRTPQELKTRTTLEIRTWYDHELLLDLYINGRGTLTRYYQDGYEYLFNPAIEIDAGQLLVTGLTVRKFEKRNETDQQAEKAEEIDPRERTTYLKLIRLLCELQGIDISRPYKAYEVLAQLSATKKIALPVSKNAIADKFAEARDIK